MNAADASELGSSSCNFATWTDSAVSGNPVPGVVSVASVLKTVKANPAKISPISIVTGAVFLPVMNFRMPFMCFPLRYLQHQI